MPNNQHEIRSEAVQDIMSKIPHWIIRWGMSIIFVLIGLLIFISWFIKYPDVIPGYAEISTSTPPVVLVSKSSGEVKELLFKDNSLVKKDDIITTIDDNYSVLSKQNLLKIVNNIESEIEKGEIKFQFEEDSLILGAIQDSYIGVKKSVQDYQLFIHNDPSNFDIQNIQTQIYNYIELKKVILEQIENSKVVLEKRINKFNTDKLLYERQVISKFELQQNEQLVIDAKNNLGNFKKSVIQTSITISELEKQLNSLKVEHKKIKEELLQKIKLSILTLKIDLKNWGNNSQLISPFDGKLSYLKTVHQYDYIEAGTSLFAIIPENQDYIGYLDVPKSGYGKIKTGQLVRIKIDNYPYQEFGQLEGIISSISLLPKDSVYRIEFSLPKGMRSSYNKVFEYYPEMSGTAEIITEDIRLLTRIFNKFRKIFH